MQWKPRCAFFAPKSTYAVVAHKCRIFSWRGDSSLMIFPRRMGSISMESKYWGLCSLSDAEISTLTLLVSVGLWEISGNWSQLMCGKDDFVISFSSGRGILWVKISLGKRKDKGIKKTKVFRKWRVELKWEFFQKEDWFEKLCQWWAMQGKKMNGFWRSFMHGRESSWGFFFRVLQRISPWDQCLSKMDAQIQSEELYHR